MAVTLPDMGPSEVHREDAQLAATFGCDTCREVTFREGLERAIENAAADGDRKAGRILRRMKRSRRFRRRMEERNHSSAHQAIRLNGDIHVNNKINCLTGRQRHELNGHVERYMSNGASPFKTWKAAEAHFTQLCGVPVTQANIRHTLGIFEIDASRFVEMSGGARGVSRINKRITELQHTVEELQAEVMKLKQRLATQPR